MILGGELTSQVIGFLYAIHQLEVCSIVKVSPGFAPLVYFLDALFLFSWGRTVARGQVNSVYIHHSTATGWWVLFANHLICLSNWSSSKDVHGFGGQNSINQNFHTMRQPTVAKPILQFSSNQTILKTCDLLIRFVGKNTPHFWWGFFLHDDAHGMSSPRHVEGDVASETLIKTSSTIFTNHDSGE